MQNVNFQDNFGHAIKTARQAMGMTQQNLAEKVCVTVRYLKAIENSGRLPSYSLFTKLVDELCIRAAFTIYPDSKEPSATVLVLQGKKKPDRSL